MAYNNAGNRFQQTTPIVLNLIIINVLVYLAQMLIGGNQMLDPATDLFALHHYKSIYFQPYQVVTHMFMHGGFFHLLFNMFSLWMFGTMVERAWGPKRFLIFYFICGLGAAIFQLGSYAVDWWQVDHSILSPELYDQYQAALRMQATVGASGAIMGVLAAFGYLFPNTEMIIIPIPVPIKAKWAIMGMIALDVFGGVVKVQGDNIAHFAHVGGAVIGFLLVLYWNKKNKKTFY
ncbi:MAG: rhomboid family intramembrane serine protease [Ferruginibacter sp.]